MSDFLSQLPMKLISLPIILLALSLHELAHGYAASKLGDTTAKSFGRLTLNPLKHLDPIGFLCMLFFGFGWAKPVPINARCFKKPRRDMALTAAAGPLSNIFLAILFAGLLRLDMLAIQGLYGTSLISFALGAEAVPIGYKLLAVLTYMLYLGVILNLGLAVFNLIPIPPFDGSRILHVFLPPKWYFGLMKYEQYIMIGILILMFMLPGSVISPIVNTVSSWILAIFGLNDGEAYHSLLWVLNYISMALAI